MITDFQKRIYNIHLASYKKQQKKPYTLRENFENFEQDHPQETLWLMKLEKFFTDYSGINPKMFFNAPYNIHEDTEYYSLEFYTSQAAIKLYKIYMNLIDAQSPDSSFQLEYISDSLKFIRTYCCEHKINLINYLFFKDGLTFAWAVHLAQHKISFYVILGFTIFNIPVYERMFDMPTDEQEMFLSDIIKNYGVFKNQFERSIKAQKLVHDGLKVIEKNIDDCLQLKE